MDAEKICEAEFVDVDLNRLMGTRFHVALKDGRTLENAELVDVEWLDWELNGTPVRHPSGLYFTASDGEQSSLLALSFIERMTLAKTV